MTPNSSICSVAVRVFVRLEVFEVVRDGPVFDYCQRSAKFLEGLLGERVRIFVRMKLFGQFFEVSICLLSL